MTSFLSIGSSPLSLPVGAGGPIFDVGTPPPALVGDAPIFQPSPDQFIVQFPATTIGEDPQAGDEARDAYRPWVSATLENRFFFANGYDRPWFINQDKDAMRPMGSELPPGLGAAEVVGTTFNTGDTLRYRLVQAKTGLEKESAPVEAQVTIAGGSGDVQLNFGPVDPDTGFNVTRIYRALQSTGFYVLLVELPAATVSYLDQQAIGSITLNTPYVRRFRTTFPPIFRGLVGHLNRLWGWTGLDSNLYFGQVARIDGQFVLDDFPAGNLIPIGPHDGGEITACRPSERGMVVFKRRAAYFLFGNDPENFEVRLLFDDRGCVGRRCLVMAEGMVYFLDERGLYFTDLSSEPFVAGAEQGRGRSPMEPVWARMNLDASDYFFLRHNEPKGLIECYIALDHEPVPNRVVMYDYRNRRFVSEDTGIVAFAGGVLEDAERRLYDLVMDELGYLWQVEIGNADGLYDGDASGNITVALDAQQSFTTDATFEPNELGGPQGTPMRRYDPVTGEVMDENRVWQATSEDLLPLYYSVNAPVVGEQFLLGVIPAVAQTPKMTMGVSDKKLFARVWVETDIDSTGKLRVDTARDDEPFVLKTILDLGVQDGVQVVPTYDRGRRWSLRLHNDRPGEDFVVQTVEVQANIFTDRR